jgi:hypothetical protein
MSSSAGHPDSAGRLSLEEFKRKLQADLPALERMVAEIREFCGQGLALSDTPAPCPADPTREICEKLLEGPKAHHNGSYEGKLHNAPDLEDIAVQRDRPKHTDSYEQLRAGLALALPADLYMVNENGHRQVVTAEKAEQIRQEWLGHFLLDLPRQSLVIRTGKTVTHVKLGSGRLHWGVEKVLMVGMSQPGVGFGYAKFSKVSPGGSGIGDVSALTRYVHEARRAIGDTGRGSRYIHKTRVEPSESPTRWGYVFDNQCRYMVIAKCPPTNYGQATKSIDQSRVGPDSGQ